MSLKKFISAFLTFLLFTAGAAAQNNPYLIDDVCYQYFNIGETLMDDLSNDAFDLAINALLKRAKEVNDEKARTLYYVERTKRSTRVARRMTDLSAANALVEQNRRETMAVARETGYMQYFFYAYELAQNYYVNTHQEVHAQALLTEMMDIAEKENNEYGLWQSQRYISMLYQRQNDLLNTRKYLKEVIRIYENSEDPNIRRQSLSRVFCDLGDTYLYDTDSSRFYYNKAEEHAKLPADTLRVTYYKAQIAALDGDVKQYRKCRDFCLEDPGFRGPIIGGEALFACVDDIIGRQPLDSLARKIRGAVSKRQMIYLRNLAIVNRRDDITSWLGTSIILSMYSDISFLNDLKMEEVSAVMENSRLSQEMEGQRARITRLRLAVILLAAALAAALAAILLIRHKNK